MSNSSGTPVDNYVHVDLPVIKNPIYNRLGISGLENLGATCYLNTAIQCLVHTMPLTDYILRGLYFEFLPEEIATPCVELFVDYANLLVALWEENCTVKPNTLHQTFGKHFPFYVPYTENDVQETVTFLLDNFHEAIAHDYPIQTGPLPTNRTELTVYRARKEWTKLQNGKTSIISELFYGLEHSRTQCVKCRKVNHNFAPFGVISLELDWSDDVTKRNQKVELNHLFAYYCRKDQLDRENQLHCDKCNGMSRAYKKITFWHVPQFLVVSLKRFDNYGQKIYREVDYPIEGLDLTNLITDPHRQHRAIYDLYAVALHEGASTDSGHYYSFCKLPMGDWASFDDSQVEPVKDIIQPRKAYMLFYRMRQ